MAFNQSSILLLYQKTDTNPCLVGPTNRLSAVHQLGDKEDTNCLYSKNHRMYGTPAREIKTGRNQLARPTRRVVHHNSDTATIDWSA